MVGNDFYGTPADVERLLRATGAEREALVEALFGKLTPTQTGRNLQETASGLIVPGTALTNVNPADHMYVYLTTEEIFGSGQNLSVAAIIEQVKKVSLETALAWCADWVAKLHHPKNTRQDVDAAFIAAHLASSHRTKIENLLRDPHTVLLAPQTFVVIAKIALEHSERRGEPPPDGESLRPLVLAALALPTHLARDVEEAVEDDDLVIGADGGPMGAYLVANQIFNSAANWPTAWAVYNRCFRELPRELRDHPRVVDFDTAYLDATGVQLDDLVAICAIVFARSLGEGATFPLAYFDSLNWDAARLDAVLDLISATPEALRELLREDASLLGVLWSTKTFDRFPIVRWEEYLTVLHPGWVVNRSTGLWPLLDVRRELELRGERAKAAKVAGSVQHTYEHFALEVVEAIVGSERIYGDAALRRAYGSKGKVADAAVDYGDSWVVVEVTTRGFQLGTAAGVSEDFLAQDIDDIVRKARQAEATIDNLRRDEAALTRRVPSAEVRYYPVVVVASQFAGNPITFTMLRERLKRDGVLQAVDCAPLEVLQFDDLLAMEGANEKYGCGFLDLLAEKIAIEGPLVPMIDFLAHKLRRNAPLPDRVERSRKAWMGSALARLREAGNASEDASHLNANRGD